MTIMRDKPGFNWLPVAAGALVLAGGLGYWWTSHSPESEDRPAAAAAASQPASPVSEYEALMNKPVSAPASDLPEVPPTPEQVAEAQKVATEQVQVAQKLERPEVWKPLTGGIKDKPEYVSPMEWQMLKGVAERHPDPQAELLRLTNFLRYNKLLEKWQDLPKGSDPALRQALAEQLSSELPARVANGEVDAKDALQQGTTMLRDAYPTDAKARKKAEQSLAAQIQKAAQPQ